MAGILFAGDLYLDRFDENGNSTGLVQVGNATMFKITESSDIKTRPSRMKATYGQPLDTVAVHKPAELEISVDELDKANLALALLGKDAALAVQASANQTKTFDMAAVEKGVWLELGRFPIDAAGVTVTDGAEPPAAVAPSKYEINADLGMIKFAEDAPNAGNVTVTFDVLAASGFTIDGSARPTIKARAILDGVNLADQARCKVEVYEAVLTPSSAVDFLAAEFGSVGFKGNTNTPAGKTAPYVVTYLRIAA
jgi:hypothetical protein